ncbi:MAG: polysaccharide deacetylase family protein [Longimicrobiales bacterium]|nr:polysaccharide deacetylase family protein [Longimicrobiales bacterium]
MLRKVVKSAGEAALARGPMAHVGRRVMQGRTLVLAYHNVVPSGLEPGGDRSLHLPLDDFRRQMDHLVRYADVVPLPEMAARPDSTSGRREPASPSDRPRVVVTFDDGYRGAVRDGLDAMVERNLPATLFVAPALLGNQIPWWDALADPAGGLRPGLREELLGRLKGRTSAIRAWARQEGVAFHAAPEARRTVTTDELVRAAARPGITVGAHGWSHVALTALSPWEIAQEIARCHRWLGEKVAKNIPWIVYPYGLASTLVEEVVRERGYRGGFLVGGAWLTEGAAESGARLHLPRLTVPAGLSLDGFRARLAGWISR